MISEFVVNHLNGLAWIMSIRYPPLPVLQPGSPDRASRVQVPDRFRVVTVWLAAADLGAVVKSRDVGQRYNVTHTALIGYLQPRESGRRKKLTIDGNDACAPL
jgi:hypothetical protein